LSSSTPVPSHTEQLAGQKIDATLNAAGQVVQNRDEINLAGRRGVAVRGCSMKPGHGFADYLLFVDKKPVAVIEAKPAGPPIAGGGPLGA